MPLAFSESRQWRRSPSGRYLHHHCVAIPVVVPSAEEGHDVNNNPRGSGAPTGCPNQQDPRASAKVAAGLRSARSCQHVPLLVFELFLFVVQPYIT